MESEIAYRCVWDGTVEAVTIVARIPEFNQIVYECKGILFLDKAKDIYPTKKDAARGGWLKYMEMASEHMRTA